MTRVLDLSYNNLGHVFPLLLDNLRFLNRAALRGSLRRYKLVASILSSLKMHGSRLKSLDLSDNLLSEALDPREFSNLPAGLIKLDMTQNV